MKSYRNLIILVAVILLGLGAGWLARPKTTTTNTNTVVDQCATPASVTADVNGASLIPSITYSGVNAKNALELLKANHTVDASDAGFVNAIDGIKPGDHQFWLLCVNDTSAQVGAKDLVTKSSDRIQWKLGTF